MDLLWQPRVQGGSVDLGAYEGPVAVGTEEGEPAAEALSLEAYPNPSRGPVTVRFTLASPSHVRLSVYDVLGREVAQLADEGRPAGAHVVPIAAGHLPPGVYVVRVAAGSAGAARTVTLLR